MKVIQASNRSLNQTDQTESREQERALEDARCEFARCQVCAIASRVGMTGDCDCDCECGSECDRGWNQQVQAGVGRVGLSIRKLG